MTDKAPTPPEPDAIKAIRAKPSTTYDDDDIIDYIDALRQTHLAERGRADKAEKDAERYRILRDAWGTQMGSAVVTWHFPLGNTFGEVESFDTFVDALATEKTNG